MDCKKAEQCLQPYIDGTLDDRDLGAYLQHVRNCPSCRRELQTDYSICYLLQYVTEDEKGELSYDMRKVLEEDMRKNEYRLRIRLIFRTIRHLAIFLGDLIVAGTLLWLFYEDVAESILRYFGL